MNITKRINNGLVDSEVYRQDGYSIFRRMDGIIQIEFEAGFYGELEDAKKIIEVYKQLSRGERCLILAIYEEDNLFSKEVREFVSSEEVSKTVKADAFVVNGLALKLFGNLYLKINKPKRPSKMFNNKEEAVLWLKQLP